jgi:predicted P-loop ATPase
MNHVETIKNTIQFFHKNKIGAAVQLNPGAKRVTIPIWQQYNSSNLYPNLRINTTNNYTIVNDPTIIVLDVDTKKIPDEITKKAYEKALFSYEILKNTLSVRTPSGGFHFYFRLKNKTPLKGKFGKDNAGVAAFEKYPNLDIIDIPLNTVMPGSKTEKGEYVFINQIEPIKINDLHDLPILTNHRMDSEGQAFYDIFNRYKITYHLGEISEGKRNNTVFSIALIMAANKIPRENAIEIFNYRYYNKIQGGDFQPIEIERTFESAYKRKEEQEEQQKIPKEIIAKKYLNEHEWKFRENVIKEQTEYRQGSNIEWDQIDHYLTADLAIELAEETDKSSFKDHIQLAIDAECRKNKFHAGQNFLTTVPRQTEKDYIKEFVNALKTDVNTELLYWTFRRWLLEALYTLSGQTINNAKANRTCLVFQGPQAIGKTGLAKILVPPPLRKYYYLGDISHHRDFATLISDNVFIILDDIDNMDHAERKNLKSLITQTEVKNRKAYAREGTNRKAVSNFLATTNRQDVLSDITGNTRYFPIGIEKINWDIIDNQDDDLIIKLWGQAADDYDNNKLFEIIQKTNEFVNERRNQVKNYEQSVGAEEILNMYFSCVQPENEEHEKLELTVSQISMTFSYYLQSQERRKFSERFISHALTRMDCVTRRTKTARFKQIYVVTVNKTSITEDLRQWDTYNKTGANMPNYTKDRPFCDDNTMDSSDIEGNAPFS